MQIFCDIDLYSGYSDFALYLQRSSMELYHIWDSQSLGHHKGLCAIHRSLLPIFHESVILPCSFSSV